MMNSLILLIWMILPDLEHLQHRRRWAGSIILVWHTCVHVWTYSVPNCLLYVLYVLVLLSLLHLNRFSLMVICILLAYMISMKSWPSGQHDSKGHVDLCSIPHTVIIMPKKSSTMIFVLCTIIRIIRVMHIILSGKCPFADIVHWTCRHARPIVHWTCRHVYWDPTPTRCWYPRFVKPHAHPLFVQFDVPLSRRPRQPQEGCWWWMQDVVCQLVGIVVVQWYVMNRMVGSAGFLHLIPPWGSAWSTMYYAYYGYYTC